MTDNQQTQDQPIMVGERDSSMLAFNVALAVLSVAGVVFSALFLSHGVFFVILLIAFGVMLIGETLFLIYFVRSPKHVLEIFQDKVVLTKQQQTIGIDEVVFVDFYTSKSFFAPSLQSLTIYTAEQVFVLTNVKNAEALKNVIDQLKENSFA